MRFVPCGDAALTIQFDEPPSAALTRRIAALSDVFTRGDEIGVIECIPGLASLTVLFDAARASPEVVQAHLGRWVMQTADAFPSGRAWRIPVCYEVEHAPDMADVAAACGLDVSQVAAIHCTQEYVVYLLGFSPGFPYMGDLDPRLALPRRASPRQIVPSGSVAIASTYTAIYPQSTPGGWHIIGATPVPLFDTARAPPALLLPGDTVSFERIASSEFDRLTLEYSAGRTLFPQ